VEGDVFILIVSILQAAVRSGTPILFVCIGEIYAERSGVLNVGLEGLMLVGAIAGFFASVTVSHPVAGVLAAAVAMLEDLAGGRETGTGGIMAAQGGQGRGRHGEKTETKGKDCESHFEIS